MSEMYLKLEDLNFTIEMPDPPKFNPLLWSVLESIFRAQSDLVSTEKNADDSIHKPAKENELIYSGSRHDKFIHRGLSVANNSEKGLYTRFYGSGGRVEN